MKRYIKSDINSYSYTGHSFLDDSIILAECNTDVVYITLCKAGKVCTVDAWGYVDDDHEFYKEYPMSSIELAIADYNRLVTNWGDGTITSLSQVEAELNEWGKSLAEYGIKASTVIATTDNVANHVKYAVDMGYEEYSKEVYDDGDYTIDKTWCVDGNDNTVPNTLVYDVCYQGDMIGQFDTLGEAKKLIKEDKSRVITSTTLNASNNPFIQIYIEEGWDLTPKAYRAYLDSGKVIGVIGGEYYIADNEYGKNAKYMGDFFNVKKYFEDLASVNPITSATTSQSNVNAWTSGASMMGEAEAAGWEITQKSLFYDGEDHTVDDYSQSIQGHIISIETDYNMELDEVEHWLCIDGERVEWFETTYDAIDYAETLFETPNSLDTMLKMNKSAMFTNGTYGG